MIFWCLLHEGVKKKFYFQFYQNWRILKNNSCKYFTIIFILLISSEKHIIKMLHRLCVVLASKIVFFLLIILAACGPIEQSGTSQIVDQSTEDQRVVIPGTHCSIVPPDGFTVSVAASELVNSTGAMVKFTDYSPGNFYTSAATFSRETFEANGVSVYDYRELVINGYPAKYAVVFYDENFNAYSLAFGDSTFCVTVMGIIPAGNEQIESQFLEAFESIRYEKKSVVDPAAVANFTLDDATLPYKLLLYSGGMYTYGPDSTKTSRRSPDNELRVVVVMPLPAEDKNEDFSTYLKQRLEKNGFVSSGALKESSNSMNGYQTYQLEAQGTMRGIPALMHLVYLAQGDKAVLMQGIANADFTASAEEFRRFARAIRIKP